MWGPGRRKVLEWWGRQEMEDGGGDRRGKKKRERAEQGRFCTVEEACQWQMFDFQSGSGQCTPAAVIILTPNHKLLQDPTPPRGPVTQKPQM